MQSDLEIMDFFPLSLGTEFSADVAENILNHHRAINLMIIKYLSYLSNIPIDLNIKENPIHT